MKRPLLSLLFLFAILLANAQNVARDFAVELQSTFDRSTGNLTLNWPQDSTCQGYDIYSKSANDWTWTHHSSLNKYDSAYQVPGYSQGNLIEFWVKKTNANYASHGYIYAGVDQTYQANKSDKDILLLIIDSNYIQPLSSEIGRLIQDLENEFWEVRTHVVQRSDSVQHVKACIYSQWLSDSAQIKSLYLLGHIPVPYSGDFYADGHNPEHRGAWPSDVYYSNFDLIWTDSSVNITVSDRSANYNVPGDNKFDQWYIWPSLAKIPMGRVDLFDMPAFGNDTFLMKRYLDKNHLYRTGKLQAEKRGLIDDNFGTYAGGPAQSGWRNFTPMFGDNIVEQDYFSSQRDSSFLFSYGCGAGTYTSSNGIGSSSDFAADSLLNPFTMLFGSYYGDWDNTNNFLRAPLASKGWGLASAWSGYPIWLFHHAAQNYPIGLATALALNAYPTYDSTFSRAETLVHIQLMGDPSLRLYTLAPIEIAALKNTCTPVPQLTWVPNPQADSVEIWVYNGSQRIYTVSALASDSMIQLPLASGNYTFQIYAMDWEQNPSGFFKVMSHPLIFTGSVASLPMAKLSTNSDQLCYGDTLYFSDSSSSIGHQSFWMLDTLLIGFAKDSSLLLTTGNHWLKLIIIDSNKCSDSQSLSVYQAPELKFTNFQVFKSGPEPSCQVTYNPIEGGANFTPVYGHFMWYWGDSSIARTASGPGRFLELHNMPDAGTYNGRADLRDSSGLCQIDSSFSVTVHEKPANPILNPINLIRYQIGQVHDKSPLDTSLSYRWYTNIDSSSPGDSANVLRVSSNYPGLYYVNLVKENQYGCLSDSILGLINVDPSQLPKLQGINYAVFPNPVQSELNITFDAQVHIDKIMVVNSLGQIISVPYSIASQAVHLNLVNITPGTYFLLIETKVGFISERITKD